MSNPKPKKTPEEENAAIHADFYDYLNGHVREHNAEDCEFALMSIGFKDGDGLHLDTFMGGPPPMLAKAISDMMDELMKRAPEAAVYFLLSTMAKMKELARKNGGRIGAGGIQAELITHRDPEAGLDATPTSEAALKADELLKQLGIPMPSPDTPPDKGRLH